jgi:hypothetical protein
MNDKAFQIYEGLHADYDGVLKKFNSAVALGRLEKIYFLAGNVFRAMQLSVQHQQQAGRPLGMITAFKSEDGMTHTGLLLTKKALNEIKFAAKRLTSPDMAVAAVTEANAALRATAEASATGPSVMRSLDNPALFTVTIPKQGASKWTDFYKDQYFVDLLASYNGGADTKPTFQMDREQMAEFIRNLYASGYKMYVEGRFRNWANEWIARNGFDPEADAADLADKALAG